MAQSPLCYIVLINLFLNDQTGLSKKFHSNYSRLLFSSVRGPPPFCIAVLLLACRYYLVVIFNIHLYENYG